MIELTPKEVEACRRLKEYTEAQLAGELFKALEEDHLKDYMDNVRKLCVKACDCMSEIVKLLKLADVDIDRIDAMFQEAGPLSVYYQLKDANEPEGGDTPNKKREEEIKEINENRKKNIEGYKKKIRPLEDMERKEYDKFQALLGKVRDWKKFKKLSLSKDSEKSDKGKKGLEELKKIKIADYKFKSDDAGGDDKDDLEKARLEILKKVKEEYDTFIEKLWNNIDKPKEKDDDIEQLNDKYYYVKKETDLYITEQYRKIEWANEEAMRREALVPAKHLKKLTSANIEELRKLAEDGKLTSPDCSDIFRLFATVIEEIGGKLRDEEWKKISDDGGKITRTQLRNLTALQKSYRGTSGLKPKHLYPDMDADLAQRLRIPDDFTIDKDVKAVTKDEKIMWEQELQCIDCGQIVKKYFDSDKHVIEKSIDHEGIHYWCDKCEKWLWGEQWDEEAHWMNVEGHEEEYLSPPYCRTCGKELVKSKGKGTLKPLGNARPFYQGDKKSEELREQTDALRSRDRKSWSSSFILDKNSVVRAIDRTFGLPEGADISGTTADSIFGMETAIRLIFEDRISTRREEHKPIPIDAEKRIAKAIAKEAPLILLPLITMPRLRHHTILECAMTLVLTGYIDEYRAGEYTTLWPKGSGKYAALFKILEKWENSPANIRMIIDRDKDGYVKCGWLFDKNEDVGGFKFDDIASVNYLRYIKLFLPLRNKMKNNEEVRKATILKLMQENKGHLEELRPQLIREWCEEWRQKRKGKKVDKHYYEISERLYKKYSRV